MELEELKSIWAKYDSKLDNLEKMNKKLIRETLLKRPRRKLNWYKFQSLYGLIAVPIILIVAMLSNFKEENLNLLFLCGCVLTFGVIIYLSYLQLKGYFILKKIDFETDPIMVSAAKIAEFKTLFNTRWKHAVYYYPIIFLGTIFLAWNRFRFDSKTIIFIVLLFIITYAINIKGPKLYRDRVQRLENDLKDLKEYID
jgi:hypothetical protein